MSQVNRDACMLQAGLQIQQIPAAVNGFNKQPLKQ